MLTPRQEGGGAQGICRAFDLIAFPTGGNLTKSLGPRLRTLDFFFAKRNGTTCISLSRLLKIVFVEKNMGVILEVRTCFEQIKQLLLTIHFQYKLTEQLTLWRLR